LIFLDFLNKKESEIKEFDIISFNKSDKSTKSFAIEKPVSKKSSS
jgi:hypothetical protein